MCRATPADYELMRMRGCGCGAGHPSHGVARPRYRGATQSTGRLTTCSERFSSASNAMSAVLVTTLTKRMAEDLTEYLNSMGVAARYLHSDIDTMERMAIIKALRAGEFDVLVGINLLREGLDIPEVSLVTILDADKEGFLRSTGSLIQTFGRAARNAGGKVLLYADTVTASMRAAMGERPVGARSSRTGNGNARHYADDHQ